MHPLRIDFHVHTRASPDAIDHPEIVVQAAKRAGLNAIAVTDHDRGSGYRRLVRLGLADESGEPVDGLLVIPGVEVSTNQGHVIILGQAFDTPPRPAGINARDLLDWACTHDLLSIAPHPFDRFRSGVGPGNLASLKFDAIEACNSKTLDPLANALAADFAAQHSLPMLAGSDAHQASTVGRAYTLVMAHAFNLPSIFDAIRARRTTPVVGRHTALELARYWARGWLTRPWLVDWSSRAALRRAPRRTHEPSPCSRIPAS